MGKIIIPLRLASLCVSCECITDTSGSCPTCGNANHLLTLSCILDRASQTALNPDDLRDTEWRQRASESSPFLLMEGDRI